MAEQLEASSAAPIYRVNKFTVPAEARAVFLEILEDTLALMRRQAGFVRSLLLEQQPAPDVTQIVAVHEFADDKAAQSVIAAIAAADRAACFDRPAVITGLGIKVEMGNYHLLESNPGPQRQRRRAGFPQ